jgi:hypothetical protein
MTPGNQSMIPSKSLRPLLALAGAWMLGTLLASCGSDGGPGPDVGAPCRRNAECSTGYCCTSRACDRGTCTFRCSRDRDCPQSMGCHDGACLPACRDHFDCFSGQRCRHGGVCVWD